MKPVSNQFVDLLCEDLDSRGMLAERRTRGGNLTPGAQSRRAPMPEQKNKSKRDLLRKQKEKRKLKLQQRPETGLAVRGETKPAVRGETGLAVPEKTKPRTTIIPPRSPEGNRPARKPRGPVVDAPRRPVDAKEPWHADSGDDETKKKAIAAGQEKDLPRSGRSKDPGIEDKGSFLSRIYKSSMRDQGLDPAHRRFKSKYAWNKRANSQEMLRKSKEAGDRVDKENAEFKSKNPDDLGSQRDWREARDRVRDTPDANPEPSKDKPKPMDFKPVSDEVVGKAAPTPEPEIDRFTGKPKGPGERSNAAEDADIANAETAKVDKKKLNAPKPSVPSIYS